MREKCIFIIYANVNSIENCIDIFICMVVHNIRSAAHKNIVYQRNEILRYFIQFFKINIHNRGVVPGNI